MSYTRQFYLFSFYLFFFIILLIDDYLYYLSYIQLYTN